MEGCSSLYRVKSSQQHSWTTLFIFGTTIFFCLASIQAASNEDEICVRYEDENKDGCFCDKRPFSSIPGGYGRKIKCHPIKNKSTFPTNLPATTFHLDLSNNGLAGELNADSLSNLRYLQKLDLQGNDISAIEEKAFLSTPNLEMLDLSRNQLRSIKSDVFSGLGKLEKLRLNDNQIQTIEEGSFNDLKVLKRLELSDNSLVCDCSLSWFIKWMDTNSNLFGNSLKLKCALPIKLADVHLRKIDPEDLKCNTNKLRNNLIRENGQLRKNLEVGRTNGNVKTQVGMLEILPIHQQTVFGGDSLKLTCKAQLSSTHKVSTPFLVECQLWSIIINNVKTKI